MKSRYALTILSAALLSACAVGPDYHRPTVDTAAMFKEAPDGWKSAQPSDGAKRSDWWKVFGDATLDGLVDQLNQNNQTVAVAIANYRQARAQAAQARAGFFPTLSASLGATRGRSTGSATGLSPVSNSKSVSLDAGWEPDLWGGVRRANEESSAKAESSAASLALARLTAQAELVQDYLQLYVVNRQHDITSDSVKSFQKTLQITRNQLSVGLVTPVDVAQAEAQVKTAEAQLLDYELSSRQLEHAIAILVGKPPAAFSIASPTAEPLLPTIPAQTPSSLLERRPDIAAAERNMAAANAQIGVAQAAYFPALTLSATGGDIGSQFSKVLSTPLRNWSIGASLAETLFDGGARMAQKDAAVAAYDGSVAQYRQTVLTGLQEVEDNLAAINLLADESARQSEAVIATREAERLSINEYKAGTVDFTVVVTNQAARHQAEISALQIMGRRYSAYATLVKALGGGWDGDFNPKVADAR
jgi:NodT family efflux transporter outer membrane factor (OMF) lipoprotein